MQGQVLKDQLTYIDTEKGIIQILDKAEDDITALGIDIQTHLPGSWG
jgi:hypothetical protein